MLAWHCMMLPIPCSRVLCACCAGLSLNFLHIALGQYTFWERWVLLYIHTRVFHKLHFAKKKRCNTSMHPSRVYINQIWKNFFPKTSLEGLATWSKKATQGSLFVAKTYFLIIVQPLWIPSGVPRRGCSIFFCPNTLPFFATDTYKLVAQGSLFIWVYSDYLSFSI